MESSDLVVIPNGVDFKKFSPTRRSESLRLELFGADSGRPVIGVIGRLDPQKGQLEFLQAAERVLKEVPEAQFVLIGRPNRGEVKYFSQLKDFINQRGLTKSVRWIDHLDDVGAAFASLDLFVLPSYKEAFGNVLVEAMASGVPIVATQAGGPSEMIQSGRTGILVPPRNVEALSTAILEFLRNPSLSRRCWTEALAAGRERYDLPRVLSQIEDLAISKEVSFDGSYEVKRQSSPAS
jgi:glycosyltransferase involved in cell wall biosynthesis